MGNTLQIHRKTVSQTIKLKSTMFLQAHAWFFFTNFIISSFYKCYTYIYSLPSKKNLMKYLSFYTLHGAGRITANHINGIANVFNDPSAKSEDRLAYRVMPEKDNLTTCTRHL